MGEVERLPDALFWVRDYDPASRNFRLEPIYPVKVFIKPSKESQPKILLHIGEVVQCQPRVVTVKYQDPSGAELLGKMHILNCYGDDFSVTWIEFEGENK